MAHVFKIIQKKFQIAPDGSSYTQIQDLEFISQPFATPEECNSAAILKNNELVIADPANVIALISRFNGTGTNGHYSFEDHFRMFGCGVHYDWNYAYAEQVKNRYKIILERERPR